MHLLWIILEVIGGICAVVVILAILAAVILTSGGRNPFQ